MRYLEASRPAVDVALVDAGQKLAGPSGYACVTCHAVGTTPALQAFEGQGVNLQLSAARLRYDYFQRWMHFPQRIDPSTIMPRYVRERDRALLDAPFDGDAARQFEAIWAWMQSQRTESTKR